MLVLIVVNFFFYLPNWNGMYLLRPGPSGALSMTDKQPVSNRLEKLISMIKFCVFEHEYKRAYIGTLENLEQD